jgi:hypothetical protein
MDETTARVEALRLALAYGTQSGIDAADIVQTAAMFYLFLTANTPVSEPHLKAA